MILKSAWPVPGADSVEKMNCHDVPSGSKQVELSSRFESESGSAAQYDEVLKGSCHSALSLPQNSPMFCFDIKTNDRKVSTLSKPIFQRRYKFPTRVLSLSNWVSTKKLIRGNLDKSLSTLSSSPDPRKVKMRDSTGTDAILPQYISTTKSGWPICRVSLDCSQWHNLSHRVATAALHLDHDQRRSHWRGKLRTNFTQDRR
jgi:hypothetical protein